jgi:hypothetical protein
MSRNRKLQLLLFHFASFVSKASRFTLLVSKQSFSVNEPSSIWLFQYKRSAAR